MVPSDRRLKVNMELLVCQEVSEIFINDDKHFSKASIKYPVEYQKRRGYNDTAYSGLNLAICDDLFRHICLWEESGGEGQRKNHSDYRFHLIFRLPNPISFSDCKWRKLYFGFKNRWCSWRHSIFD